MDQGGDPRDLRHCCSPCSSMAASSLERAVRGAARAESRWGLELRAPRDHDPECHPIASCTSAKSLHAEKNNRELVMDLGNQQYANGLGLKVRDPIELERVIPGRVHGRETSSLDQHHESQATIVVAHPGAVCIPGKQFTTGVGLSDDFVRACRFTQGESEPLACRYRQRRVEYECLQAGARNVRSNRDRLGRSSTHGTTGRTVRCNGLDGHGVAGPERANLHDTARPFDRKRLGTAT